MIVFQIHSHHCAQLRMELIYVIDEIDDIMRLRTGIGIRAMGLGKGLGKRLCVWGSLVLPDTGCCAFWGLRVVQLELLHLMYICL